MTTRSLTIRVSSSDVEKDKKEKEENRQIVVAVSLVHELKTCCICGTGGGEGGI